MERSMRHVLVVLMLCFVALFVQLNRVQIIDAEALREHPANTRTVQRNFAQPRGLISTVDGTVVARSVPSDGPFERLREYPEGDLYAHVAGYLSFNLGADGVERSYNDELIGETTELQLSGLSDLLGEGDNTGQVVLTLRHDLQAMARDLLGERDGSVVMLDPETGEILTMWSYPSYDPNALAGADGTAVNNAYAALVADEANPLRAKAYRDIFFPGSTFKVITAAAGMENGLVSLTSPVFPVETSYTPPLTTRGLSNFGGRNCGGDVMELLRVSCNTGFARLGAEMVGPSRMIEQAQEFGFNSVPPIDIPGAVASRFPTDYGEEMRPSSLEIPAGVYEDTPGLAQASIGQNDVAASPLHMALVAAAFTNAGKIPSPHVVAEIQNTKGQVVESSGSSTWQTPISANTAEDLRRAMINVVENGTAGSISISGLEIGAKTGTAQLGTDPPASHAWMIAFAGQPGQPADLAIAVLVEGTTGSEDQTGGGTAGPIVRALIEQFYAQ